VFLWEIGLYNNKNDVEGGRTFPAIVSNKLRDFKNRSLLVDVVVVCLGFFVTSLFRQGEVC